MIDKLAASLHGRNRGQWLPFIWRVRHLRWDMRRSFLLDAQDELPAPTYAKAQRHITHNPFGTDQVGMSRWAVRKTKSVRPYYLVSWDGE
jgi:hypothetical protein